MVVGGPGGGFFVVVSVMALPLLLLLSRNHRQDHQNHHQDHQQLQSRPFKQTITSPYSEIFMFSILICGAINIVLGDVLGGSGGGFGRCGGMFWEDLGRVVDVKT